MKALKLLQKSFKNAWRGLLTAFAEEMSFRVQIIAALVAGVMLLLLPLERWERSLLILCISAVLVLELLNSIIERFVDMVKPRVHEYARVVKDLSAAAVLIMAITAVVLAVLIFWPHIYLLTSL